MDHIPRLSEVLYVGLCRTLGTPTEVAIRRDVRDMVELIQKPLDTELRRMWSGSYREGFRLESSDRDIMYWSQYHKMISEISQTNIYDASKHTIILMEDTGVPPGFVRLQILTPPRDNLSTLACVSFSDKYYLSNLLWREKWLQVYKNIKAFQNVDGHGPCTTGFFAEIEFDYALCLTSTHWPKTALFWIERSLKYIWPPAYVLEEIQRNRFHCVPIGSNIPSSYNEIEWRLSFSRAEQKLVYTMNHTQFLCYGLLKLFLKEVINYRTEEPLLCSYHIKTTLFWVIQLGSIQWHPNNLLHCVWKCLKYLIHCVYHGTFSNFFIPENNMFTNKVVGDARNCLFEQLNKYYQLGVSCLLLSPSLSSILEKALRIPSYVIPFVNGHLQSAEEIDMRVACEVLPNSFEANEFNTYYLYLKSIESFLQFSFSPYQTLTQQICIAQTMVYMAFHRANNSSCCTHRDLYALDRSLCNMLKLAGKIGTVSDSLFLALYYYRMGRYNKARHLNNIIRKRISQPFIIYFWLIDRRIYEIVCNMSLSSRMKIAWAGNLQFGLRVPVIQELMLEQQVSEQNGGVILTLSPFLLIEMLSILTNYRLGNKSQCLQSLIDLKTLLLYDDGRYVPLSQRDISWEILGICQHVVGDLYGALQSYQVSLKQKPMHKIQKASEARIKTY